MPFAGSPAIDGISVLYTWTVGCPNCSLLLRSPRRIVKDSLSSSLTRVQGGGPSQENMQRLTLCPKVVCELLQRLGRFCCVAETRSGFKILSSLMTVQTGMHLSRREKPRAWMRSAITTMSICCSTRVQQANLSPSRRNAYGHSKILLTPVVVFLLLPLLTVDSARNSWLSKPASIPPWQHQLFRCQQSSTRGYWPSPQCLLSWTVTRLVRAIANGKAGSTFFASARLY